MARPREFDTDQALEKAMHLFWAKGYHDSSIRDLVDATGVNYYGLYSVFDDKQGLFLASLDLYTQVVTRDVLSALDTSGPAKQAVQAAFDKLVSFVKPKSGHAGCMICTAAIEVAPYDKKAAAKVRVHMERLKKAFEQRLSKDPSVTQDTAPLGEYFATNAYALGVLARAGKSTEFMKQHIQTTLSVLL